MVYDYKGLFYGFIVGDAVCAPYEFLSTGMFLPVTKLKYEGLPMAGMNKGIWTDDTSMSIALLHSLIVNDGHNPKDEMDRYIAWWKTGKYTPIVNGKLIGCFDIGIQVKYALTLYESNGVPYAGAFVPKSNGRGSGNGSLMRTPFAIMFFYAKGLSEDEIVREVLRCGKTTHDTKDCDEALELYTRMLNRALLGESKDCILNIVPNKFMTTEPINSGYVFETLRSVIYTFNTTNTYEDGLIQITNRGNDADTVGAIFGALAGAYYGYSSIPKYLIKELNHSHIDELFELFKINFSL